MTGLMVRRFQFLRDKMPDRESVKEAPSSENPIAGQITINLQALSGIKHHSLEHKSNINDVTKKKMRLSRRLGRSVGKGGTPADAGNDSVPVTASPSLAKAVVWYQHDESKSSIKRAPKYFSGWMSEESMDDEGNVVSWSCVWPSETSSFNVPLPLTEDEIEPKSISLGLGLQLPGQKDIQVLGVATVTIPKPDSRHVSLLIDNVSDKATMEGIHPLREMRDVTIPVNPFQQKRSLSSRFVKKEPTKCEYSTSNTTVLKLELQLDSRMSSSTSSRVNYFTTKNDQGSETESVGTDDTSKSSIASKASINPIDSYYDESDEESTTVTIKYLVDVSPVQKKDDASKVSVNPSSHEFQATIASDEGSKTVNAADDVLSDATEGFAIGTDESRLETSPAKPKRVVGTPLRKKLKELKTHLVGPPDASDGQPKASDGQPKASVDETSKTNGKHEPLLAVIELNHAPSNVAKNITVSSSGTPPQVKVPRVPRNRNHKNREHPRNNKNRKQLSPAMPNNSSHAETISCVTTLAEVIDDAVEGLYDIATHGICVEQLFPYFVDDEQSIQSITSDGSTYGVVRGHY